MRGRKYLNDKIELWGEGDNGTYFPRTFRIKRKISRGAACICYELKENGYLYSKRKSISI